MAIQIALVLVLQLIFFTIYYNFGVSIAKIIGRRVCPVCFSVGSTWLTLILVKSFGLYPIDKLLIALLLSQSVVGVSYLVEEFTIVRNVSVDEAMLKFGIIIYGTFAVSTYAFIHEMLGFVLFLPVISFGFYSLTPVKTSFLDYFKNFKLLK